MTVNSLAVWHSYLGLHARWVLGVRHDKERSARKRKRILCRQDGCGNKVVQGGLCQAWGESETLQARRVQKKCQTRRSL